MTNFALLTSLVQLYRSRELTMTGYDRELLREGRRGVTKTLRAFGFTSNDKYVTLMWQKPCESDLFRFAREFNQKNHEAYEPRFMYERSSWLMNSLLTLRELGFDSSDKEIFFEASPWF